MAHDQGDAVHGASGHDHTAGANARSRTIALAITGTFQLTDLGARLTALVSVTFLRRVR